MHGIGESWRKKRGERDIERRVRGGGGERRKGERRKGERGERQGGGDEEGRDREREREKRRK